MKKYRFKFFEFLKIFLVIFLTISILNSQIIYSYNTNISNFLATSYFNDGKNSNKVLWVHGITPPNQSELCIIYYSF